MATSDAKLAAMRRMMGSWDAEEGRDSGDRWKAVYVGDSATDIECLTAHGITGIVMCNDGKSSLMDMLQRVQIKVEKCGESDDSQRPRTVSWEEVMQALETLRMYEMQRPDGTRETLDTIDMIEKRNRDRRSQMNEHRSTSQFSEGTRILHWASDFDEISKFLSLSTSTTTIRDEKI